LKFDRFTADAQPREIFITACLLIPIIGIGLYPKLATNTYDVKMVEVAVKSRAVLPELAIDRENTVYSNFLKDLTTTALVAPKLVDTNS
jgi:NAD(P)H-quinone oxidoreductase subunit 4